MITGLKPEVKAKSITDSVQKAKKYNIEKLYPGELKQTGGILLGTCPFHKDDTPSFAYYPKTNTWHCFSGCEGSDAIAFYMKLHSVDFKTAVEALQ